MNNQPKGQRDPRGELRAGISDDPGSHRKQNVSPLLPTLSLARDLKRGSDHPIVLLAPFGPLGSGATTTSSDQPPTLCTARDEGTTGTNL
jgi:hypothetical protein